MPGTSDRILLEFGNEAQAKAFFDWFKRSGFDDFTQSDSVYDDLPQEEFPQCISADEEPDAMQDRYYFIQIE